MINTVFVEEKLPEGTFVVDRVDESFDDNHKSIDFFKLSVDLARESATNILSKLGVTQNDPRYSFKHYELTYSIYHAIKNTKKSDL